MLDLSGNRITDLSVVDALSSCPKLKSVSFARNPINKAPRYRLVVSSLLPKVDLLDGSPVDHEAANKITNGMILEAASVLSQANDEMEDEMRMEASIMDSSTHASTTAPSAGDGILADTGSELTHGDNSVMAGGVAAAMRKRRNKQNLVKDVDQSFERDSWDIQEGIHSNRSSLDVKSKGKEKFPDSTLDILDAAFQEANGKPSTTDEDLPFFGEGDITLAVATHLGMIPSVDGDGDFIGSDVNGPNTNLASLSPKRSTLLSSHAFSPQITKRPPSRGASTKGAKESTRSLEGLSLSSNRSADPELETSSKSPRPMSSSGKGVLLKRPSSRSGFDFSDPTDPCMSGRASQSSSKASSRQSSRGSSRNGFVDGLGNCGLQGDLDDVPGGSTLQRLRSPHQLNASRPVTADASAALPFLGFGGAASVPFIVVADEEDRKQLKDSHALRNSPNTSTGSTNLFNGHTKSIVHLDLVRQGIGSRPSSASGKRPGSATGSRPNSGSSADNPRQNGSSSGIAAGVVGSVDEECITPRMTVLPRISPAKMGRTESGTPSVVSAYGDDDDDEEDESALNTLVTSSLIKFPVTGIVGLSGKQILPNPGATQSSMVCCCHCCHCHCCCCCCCCYCHCCCHCCCCHCCHTLCKCSFFLLGWCKFRI